MRAADDALERHGGQIRRAVRDRDAKPPAPHELYGERAESGGEQPIGARRRAAPLQVAEDRESRLASGQLLEVPGHALADAAEAFQPRALPGHGDGAFAA